MYRIAHTPRHREHHRLTPPEERSRRLHNFTLPELKWGNQRLLRCVPVTNNRRSSPEPRRRVPPELIRRRSPPETSKKSRPSNPFDGDGNGIDAVREKLMNDLRLAADRMKVSILEDKELDDSGGGARPWNLRTRRAACKAPPEEPAGGPPPAKSSRLRGLAAAAATEESELPKEPLRSKVTVPLSRSEIERDFLVMAGIKPPRRPKKRAKIVQRQVDACFPGLWLTEITPEKYKVPDNPESTKS